MDADTFKQRIQDLGYSYSEFAQVVGASIPKVKAVARGANKVPYEWIQKLEKPDTLPEPVTVKVTQSPYWRGMPKYGLVKHVEVKGSGKDFTGGLRRTIINPAPVGNPHDILDDGYARGYPGDDWMMRVYYRTPEAIVARGGRSALVDAGYPVDVDGVEVSK